MKPAVCKLVGLIAVAGLIPTAQAAGLHPLEETCAGYRRNVLWPWPYVCSDRMHVRAPFNVMVRNGWRRQNLLGDHHFSEDTGELTRAGELKVYWVMNQAPAEHRQVFVTRLHDRQLTEQRLAKVRSYARAIAFDNIPPLVSDTHLISEGRPAATVDSINTAFRDSMPIPTLPAASLGGEQ